MSNKSCTFFGHRNTPNSIIPLLHKTLTELIENQGVNTFYVGNQGRFDGIVETELKKIKEIYPNIIFYVVLAYMPGEKKEFDSTDYSDTIYPDGLEKTPSKFAIDKRNHKMIEWSDIVVTYVRNSFGGAAKFKQIAENKKKTVINLYDFKP